MPCPNCKSTARVAIGRKNYCSNCGESVGATSSAPPQKSDAKSTTKSTVSPQPIRSVAQPKAMAPAKPVLPVVAPIVPQRIIRDIGGIAPTSRMSERSLEQPAKPAAAFHARLKPARGGVLDLRAQKPKAIAAASMHASRATVAAPKSTITPAKTAVPKVSPVITPPATKHTAIAAKSMHSPAKTRLDHDSTPIISRQKRVHEHLEAVGQVKRSELINRFTKPAAPKTSQPPTVVMESTRELPAHTASQHEHLSRLIEVMKEDRPGAHKQATKPSRASFATAALAIGVFGSYIWFHNYPHLAISAAADKAGFSASLPGFIPSSYSLKGGPSYSPGLVTLSFASPSFKDPMKVTQQPTAWDTRSLLDNYVASKDNSYTTVSGQGLTIYLVNGSKEATWINHGIWYSVVGTTNVSRDQLLKMAYSF